MLKILRTGAVSMRRERMLGTFGFFYRKHLVLGGSKAALCLCAAIGTSVLLSAVPTAAQDFRLCVECHESLSVDGSRALQHAPFLDKECALCHLAKEPEPTEDLGPAALKIDWLAESGQAYAEHAYLLVQESLRSLLVVDVPDAHGDLERVELPVPPLEALDDVLDTGSAPNLAALELLSVQKGIFLTAVIGWTTDTLSTAQVHYGEGEKLSQSSAPGKRLGFQHQVVLRDLKPGRTYRWQAQSQDLFGRSQTSEVLNFSTDQPYVAPKLSAETEPRLSGEAAALGHRFWRVGSDYLVTLQFEKPTSVFVGSRGKVRMPVAEPVSEPAEDGDDVHRGLSSTRIISYIACLNCHAPHMHPVDVATEKPDIQIPAHYPTLEDGKITCVSCHAPHSSEHSLLFREESQQALCAGCHRKWVR